jgi:hypothetical protein
MRLSEDRVIATTAAERRLVARVVLKQGEQAGMFAMAAADTHLHAAAGCSERAAKKFAQRIGSSLRQRLGLPVGFLPTRPKPIQDIWHLRSALTYILDQSRRHGLATDPFFEATNLPDLLGLRVLGRYTVRNLCICPQVEITLLL